MLRPVGLAFVAALVSTGFSALARFRWEGLFPPELMAQILFANIPVWGFTPLPDGTSGWHRVTARASYY